MKKYSFSELKAFVGRASTLERVMVAYEYIEKLTYITKDMYCELMSMLMDREESLVDAKYEAYYHEFDYSPSCPWNAPGMKVSDFI